MNYQFNRGKTARQKQAAAEVSAARVLALASSLRFPGIQWISISRRRGKALTAKLATRGRERRNTSAIGTLAAVDHRSKGIWKSSLT
jgi:hypothetical protein